MDKCNQFTIWKEIEKTIDKKIDEKKAEESEKINIRNLDRRIDIRKTAQFKVEDTFGDFSTKEGISS